MSVLYLFLRGGMCQLHQKTLESNQCIKKKHCNGLVDSYRLVDKNRLSSVEKVTVRFVAKGRRVICDHVVKPALSRKQVGITPLSDTDIKRQVNLINS